MQNPEEVGKPARLHALGGSSVRALQLALVLIPTANGILLIIQSTLAEPPINSSLPPWVYLVVNGAVVASAALIRITSLMLGNPAIRLLLGEPMRPNTDDPPDAS
jgi:hypothetical protein